MNASSAWKVDDRMLSVARAIVCEASQLSRAVLRNLEDLQAVTKDDRSPVTVGDFAVQALVIHRLREAFGEAVIVGEERAQLLRSPERRTHLEAALSLLRNYWPEASAEAMLEAIDGGAGDSSARAFWTLDPIDGTKGFLRRQQYCTALAYVVDGKPRVGVLGCPHLSLDPAQDVGRADATGSLFYATDEGGAFVTSLSESADETLRSELPRRLGVAEALGEESRKDAAAHPVVFCESFESGHSAHDLPDAISSAAGIEKGAVLRLDSQCKYGVVARGQADVYVRVTPSKGYVERIWDHAAGALIASEAGCVVTDALGRPLDFTSGTLLSRNHGILVASASLHARLLVGTQSLS